jgi:ATP-binding cassette subfamily B (MDR/TAP) protein 1
VTSRSDGRTNFSLDPRAEKVVQDALNRVSTNKTTLIIAHKLATVKKADNIAVMSHGEVVEQGTHSELIARGGQYAAMVTSQNLGDEEGEAKLDADSDEDEDVATSHAQRLALRRTKTETASVGENKELKHLVSETLNHSLLRSILIMCREQKDQYLYFFISFIASLIAGGIYPAQAIIFSRLINVFTILDGSGQSEANFWALMFFVLAIAGFIGTWSMFVEWSIS